ncbi:MAG: Nif3-like dinuclear metal center hexameric protein, partial [Spirochaetota bacterium]
MKLSDFDAWARTLLDIDSLAGVDDSLNGVQVGRSDGDIERVAFAVDASFETIRRAAELGAQLLFVHHGLFWGKPLRVEGFLRDRIKLLLDSDIALYACHLPLDRHPEVGNNAV